MNILFMTIGDFKDIEDHGIYPDLLRCFRDHGHEIYIVSHHQRREKIPTELKNNHGAHILSVKIGNITKCGMFEKGVSTLAIEQNYKNAIKKYFSDIRFDLILYSTPPITLGGVIEYVKKRDGAETYLLLKDIFPQNAVDLKIIKKTGVKSLVYRMFRKKEQKLYQISDHIGCMSPANVEYVLKHNPGIAAESVEVCPNCIEIIDRKISEVEKKNLRKKYGIPEEKIVFVYGGNLGKPQGVSFIIDCLRTQRDNNDVFFLIVGSGTEYGKLEKFVQNESQENVKLINGLPKEEYDYMIASCDVGMIFLDHKFTIPNFPSRILSYMQVELPVLVMADKSTDIGSIVEKNSFGFYGESNSKQKFSEIIQKFLQTNFKNMGKLSRKFLEENYSIEIEYKIICDAIKK